MEQLQPELGRALHGGNFANVRDPTKHARPSAAFHAWNRADWTYSIQVPSMPLRVSSLPLVDRCTCLSITRVSWRRRWRAIVEDMSLSFLRIIWATFN